MDKLVTGVMEAEVVNEITMGIGITKTMSKWQTVKTKPMWSQQQTRTNDKTHTHNLMIRPKSWHFHSNLKVYITQNWKFCHYLSTLKIKDKDKSFCHGKQKKIFWRIFMLLFMHAIKAYSDQGLLVFKKDKNVVHKIYSLNSRPYESIQ